MPPLRLSKPGVGAIQLLEWFDQGSGEQPIEQLADFVQPTQQMWAFQQRRFWITDSQSLAQGQRVTWTLTVPPDEGWEIDHITIFTNDDDIHTVRGIWGPPSGVASPRMPMFRIKVQENVLANVFPVRSLNGAITSSDQFEFIGRMKLAQTERLQIEDETAIIAVAGAVVTLAVRAHNIPIAITQDRRDALAVATIL